MEQETTDQIPKQTIEKLAVIHLDRYSRRLERARSGATNYNPVECHYYLALWQSMERKGFDWAQFTEEEKGEVRDAFFDQDG